MPRVWIKGDHPRSGPLHMIDKGPYVIVMAEDEI